MQTWKEHFYAQRKDAFCVLVEWAKGTDLAFHLRKLDHPWIERGSLYDYELVIELPFGNKEMLKALFVLVDAGGFSPSTDLSGHFKEERTDEGDCITAEKGKIAA